MILLKTPTRTLTTRSGSSGAYLHLILLHFVDIFATILFNFPIVACNNSVINLTYFFGNLDNCVLHYITISPFSYEDQSLKFDVDFQIPTVVDVFDKKFKDQPPSSVYKIYRTKFTSCLVTLLNINRIFTFGGNRIYADILTSQNVLSRLILTQENPDILCFLNWKSIIALDQFFWTNMLINPSTGLPFTLTSNFFVLNQLHGTFELQVICQVCWVPNTVKLVVFRGPTTSKSQPNTFDAIKSWKKIHSNMQRSWVAYDYSHPFLDNSCKDRFQLNIFYPVNEKYCTIFVLSKLLNFSRYQSYPDQYPVSNINQGAVASRGFTEIHFLRRGFTKQFWSIYGCSYNPYIFVTFFHMRHMYATTLLKPFDSTIWILSIIFLFVLPILMTWLTSNYMRSGIVRRFRNIFLWSIAALLEQSDESMTREFRLRELMGDSAAFLAASWLITCFVLGAGYKAAFSSVLTALLPPTVPQSIRELMNTGIMYGSTTKHYYLGNPYSTLRDQVITDLWDNNAKDWSYNNFLHNFLQKCQFFNGSDMDLVSNISQNNPIRLGNSLAFMPSTFAVISIEKDVLSFTRLMMKFTNLKGILNKDLSPFITRYPWYGDRTFFSVFFNEGLGRLYESGIYNYWKSNNEIYTQLGEMKRKYKEQNQTFMDVNYLAQLFLKHTAEGTSGLTRTEQPILLESVLAAFIAYGVILGLAIIMLVFEALFSCGSNKTTDVMILVK